MGNVGGDNAEVTALGERVEDGIVSVLGGGPN